MLRILLSGRSSLAALLLSTFPALAHAQAYERIAPHQPPAPKAPSLAVAAPISTTSGGSQAVLVAQLKGLVFVDSSQSVIPNGAPDTQTGIHQKGLPDLASPEFKQIMSPFLSQQLTMARLKELSFATQKFYRAHGRPFLFVSVPPQNISNGIVQVVVTQYRVGTVRVVGNRWFSSGLIKRESGLRSGQTIELTNVRADMNWLNANDFRTVNVIFSPGSQLGATDVTLQTKDRFPVYVYGTYDNQGVPNLGRREWGVGAVWGNAFGRDQVVSYQFTRSATGQYNAHSMNWSIPLPWRDKLVMFGSYSTERPSLGAAGQYFNERGHSGQVSLRYVHNFHTLKFSPFVLLTSDIQLGYDFKASNNNLEFGGVRVFDSTAEIDQFPIIFDTTETDRTGQTVFQNELDLSSGGLTGANNNKAFKNSVPGSSASYYLEQISLTRTTFLPYGFSWSSHVMGQFSNHNQLDSNQMALGGMYSVRGYDTDTALGSEGLITQNEIRTPAFSFIGLTNWKSAAIPRDAEQLGVFFDYGHVSQIRPIPGAVNAADLSSVGFDLHTTLGRYVTVAWDVGWRLRNAPTNGGQGKAFGDVSLDIGL